MSAPPTNGDRPIRIVIAEDEAIIRLDLKETLEDEGYVVVADCSRGDVAIEMVREHRPDVVILDVNMPGLDGIETCRRITAERDAAVVLLTAFSQRELIEQARDAGALAYLVKPFNRRDLVPAVEIAIARHAELRELTEHADTLAERLEARKIINRAKGKLMDAHQMSEGDAFAAIQQRAMSGRRSS